jgi:hypothetical protein
LSPYKETVDFALQVASEQDIGLSTIEGWLRKHICPLNADDARLAQFADRFPGGIPALKKEISEVENLLKGLADTAGELHTLNRSVPS